MKAIGAFGAAFAIIAMTSAAPRAQSSTNPLIVTASNQNANQLLVYDTQGTLVQTLSTGGQGGVSGNAGGIAVSGDTVGVVNFGSSSVSLFNRNDAGLALSQVITVSSQPVSVAFGKDHLYVLGLTTVESHRISDATVDPAADGVAALVIGDGSAAQVGVTGAELVISEKSNTVEAVALVDGAVSGGARPVSLPPDSNAPFGLVTRGANAYVTIAHSDEVSLIKNDTVLAITATGTPGGAGQHAPCWITVLGPYLFTANSPSHSISRLIGTGTEILIDDPVAAQTLGAPTDIAAVDRLIATVDSADGIARVTQWTVADDGALTQAAQVTVSAPINGIGIVR